MPRVATNSLKVMTVLLRDDDLHGLAIGQAADLPRGSIYATLNRMVTRGWVTTDRETGDPSVLERPLRTFYRLTPAGRAVAVEAVADLREKLG